MSNQKNLHDVHHGNDGLAKNPQANADQRHQGAVARDGESPQWHGHHGAFHNPNAGPQVKADALDKMQSLAKDAGKR
ncbi:hypothetical protein JCM8115_004425 [Rhodotorula mucilaginosa]|uniref:Uncharacterized protein n=1 Tax=Rhodotorula mucilaginosa TaxID=5537 RepID=A0A9P6VXV8_RHOMI|nr:hypothetical protein C6P46_005560 [Rhodotorula mucilaginosa]